jgi:hypothetical protein
MKTHLITLSFLLLLLCIYTNKPNHINDKISLAKKEQFAVKNSDNDLVKKLDYSLFNKLLQNHVSEKGVVNYRGFIKDNKSFSDFLSILSENTPTSNWSREEKLAFWMNTYNAFTIKLIIDHYPLKSIKNIKKPWDKRFFKIGNKNYSLNDIEHQILRKMNDPRIHFGINCASYSCPTLSNKAFTAATVDKELDVLAGQFINDPKRNTLTENSVELSKIFQWFAKDFKKEGSLIDYLNKYAKIRIQQNAKKKI